MSVVCPNGHRSDSTDYCDTCGAPIPAAASASSSPSPSGSSSAHPSTVAVPVSGQSCPNCSFPALADALFCENCGYDFTTGSLPEVDPAPLLPPQLGAPAVPAAGAEAAPGAAAAAASVSVPVSAPAPTPAAAPAAAPSPEPDPDPDPGSGITAATAPPTAVPPVAVPSWVAEVWVDPEWYESQRAEDPVPSGGMPSVVVLRQRSVLVGRPSASRGITPDIDCGLDSGVSRRHCQLNSDGQRWWVEDLQSANGTYVSPAGDALPTVPLIPGQRREIGDGDRIYVGGWTRLVIRRALPGEV